MAGMDKVTRVLTMYSMLIEGGKIYKGSFCKDAAIGKRTFDRDIEDIRLFLSESFQGSELVYSKTDECYQLSHYHRHKALSCMEVAFLLELLQSSRSLRQDEYAELVHNVFMAGEGRRRNLLKKIAERYKHTYYAGKKETASLKMLWDLQQSIAERDMVKLYLPEEQESVVSPVMLWHGRDGTYLFAYDRSGDLTVIPVNGIRFFQLLKKKFDGELIEKFDSMTWQEINEKLEKEDKGHEKD